MRFFTFDRRPPDSEEAELDCFGSFTSFESVDPMEKSDESLRLAFFLGVLSMMPTERRQMLEVLRAIGQEFAAQASSAGWPVFPDFHHTKAPKRWTKDRPGGGNSKTSGQGGRMAAGLTMDLDFVYAVGSTNKHHAMDHSGKFGSIVFRCCREAQSYAKLVPWGGPLLYMYGGRGGPATGRRGGQCKTGAYETIIACEEQHDRGPSMTPR